jgi:hypothetical protein
MGTDHMLTTTKTVLLLAMALFSTGAFQENATAPSARPEYTSDSQLKYPEHYRDWVYLTSGFDMIRIGAGCRGNKVERCMSDAGRLLSRRLWLELCVAWRQGEMVAPSVLAANLSSPG